MPPAPIMLFSLYTGRPLAERVAQELGITLASHEERDFEDGEHKIRPLESVRNRDVYVLQSLYGEAGYSVNDKLIRVLFLLGALRDAGAARLHAVIPYLAYARKDRRTKPRDPLSIRYVAQLFEAIGIDTMTVMDVHNEAAFENAFRCRTIHLSARASLIDYFAPILDGKNVTVASPDIGGVKRAETFREAMSERLDAPVGSAFMEKRRSEGVVSGNLVAGDIRGRSIVILDDLIAGGTTMRRAAEAFIAGGAEEVYAAATHGAFGANAATTLDSDALRQIVVTNTIGGDGFATSPIKQKLVQIDVAATIAGAIGHIRDGTGDQPA